MVGRSRTGIALEPFRGPGLVAGCRFVLPLELLGHSVSRLFPVRRHLIPIFFLNVGMEWCVTLVPIGSI